MHLMVDLETGGTSPGCAIFSIGACTFNPLTQDEPISCFYVEISHKSCMELGLRFERNTMDWWKKQKTAPPNGNTHIKQALEDFKLWMSNLPAQYNEQITSVWANSPSFDLVLLKDVFTKYRMLWPYPYYYEMDVRTLKAIAFPNGDYRLNNSHNAFNDAINQSRLVQQAYLTLGLSKNETRNNDAVPGTKC